jgi:hypothetical protein
VSQWLNTGFGLVIGFINQLQVAPTINYYNILDLHNLQSLHANLLGMFPLFFTIRFLATDLNTRTIEVSLNYTLPISMYYSTCDVTPQSSKYSSGHNAVPLELRNQVKSIFYSLLQLLQTTLAAPPNLRHGPKEYTSRDLFPLFCGVTAYAEVCLPSRYQETDCISPMFCCCLRVMQGVYWAVAWQCIDMSHYAVGRNIVKII